MGVVYTSVCADLCAIFINKRCVTQDGNRVRVIGKIFKVLFWVVFLPILLFVVLIQVFSDYRPEYGRYGRRSIEKRKRKRKRIF